MSIRGRQHAVGRPALTVALAVVLVLGVAVALRLLAPEDSGDPGPASGPSDAAVPDDAELAEVVSHVDGDTIRLVGEEGSTILPSDGDTSVRLLEIDAPELDHDGGAHECYGQAARDALSALLPLGSSVWVQRDEDLHDPYDRVLLYLWLADGRMVNEELVRGGYAESVLFEPNDRHIATLRSAEDEARTGGRGLWAECR